MIDLESVDTVLSTARSVRRRLDFARPVEPEVIFDCIDVATQAPTGLGGESWRFLVVTDDVIEEHQGLQTARRYRLVRQIHRLPLAQREVLVLACIENLPQKEVAEILGLPVNTVKTHLRRARLVLVDRLAQRDGEVPS